MSDNIPFDIQMEIIKRVPDVKSLIRFRAVSKPWKSFIDSSEFITCYGARDTNRSLLRYKDNSNVLKYVYFVDDDTLTQRQQQDFAPNVTDFMKQQFNDLKVIGSSHGLLCLYSPIKRMFVLWNPSLKKSVGIALPDMPLALDIFGFAVCPVNNDPTIVKISYSPWKVEMFTLSSRRWSVIECRNVPRESVTVFSSQVVIGSCIYQVAYKDDTDCYIILSFDLIAKEFRVIDLPNDTPNPFSAYLLISKLRGSLVLFFFKQIIEVWEMEPDCSFSKLFTINTPAYRIRNILGFRKNGELVMEIDKNVYEGLTRLEVYEPCSKRINDLGISGKWLSFFMDSYKETLLLVNHTDGCVYPDFN